MHTTNKLLAALPAREFKRLASGIEAVDLPMGQVLHEHGELMQHIYFPCDSLISLMVVLEDRMTLEVGVVGNEGIVGIPMGASISLSPVRALVQRSGRMMRIPIARFCDDLDHSPALQRALQHCTQDLMMQAMQIAACSRFHLLDARLARSLLMTRDHLQSNEFHLTHEFLAHALGVRRVGVTKAATALQKKKLISYSRGNIKILDWDGLQAASCKCYQEFKLIEGHA